MTLYSVLFPQQPQAIASINPFAQVVVEHGLARLWMGQSFNIESHIALTALAGTGLEVPVGIGTALAALRSPYDAALQARSLAAALGRSVSIAYGAADPGFVTAVRGAPLAKPASYVSEYARQVRGLLDGDFISSSFEGLEAQQARLPDFSHPPVAVGTGVLRPGMASRSKDVDFVVTWLTPKTYVRDVIVPRLRRDDGSIALVATNVHCAVKRPGRSPHLLAQMGCGTHLTRPHYTDMLRQANLDVDASDPVSGARELVSKGVFVYGTAVEIATELRTFSQFGVDEVVINVTAVSLVHGDSEALDDLHEICSTLEKE